VKDVENLKLKVNKQKIAIYILLISIALFATIIQAKEAIKQPHLAIQQILTTIPNTQLQYTLHREFQIFYDTPELFLLKNNGSLSFLAQEKTSVRNKQKFNRSINYQFQQYALILPVKHYKRVKTISDKNPLLFLVKRGDRKQLIQQLALHGIKQPMRLKKIFNTSKHIHKYQLFAQDFKTKLLDIRLIDYFSQVFNSDFQLSILSIQAQPALQKNPQINVLIQKKLKQISNNLQLPLSIDTKNDYQLIYNQMKKKKQILDTIIRHPSWYKLFIAIITALAGLILIKLFFWNRIN
jgi:hypothetical protein